MKRNLALLGTIIGGAVLLSAVDVKTDYSHSVDFGQYHTYSWIKAPQASDSLWSNRIQRDVDAELAAKGWMEVPSGGQTGITAFGSTHNQQTLETFYDGLGGGWGWRGFGGGLGESTTNVENIPVGTLVVDIFDANTKKLIWRGTASEALSGKAEKNEKKLQDQVKDMFKHFPPPAKG